MRKISQVLILILVPFLSWAQDSQLAKPKLSASTQQYLWKQGKLNKNQSSVMDEYVYRLGKQNNIYISTLIKVQQGFNEEPLRSMGVHIGTKAGNIWTAQVPLDKVKEFTETPGISYIEMDQPAAPDLDSARKVTRTDMVHDGVGLPQGYSGEGVVVGIVDAGFDYTHPTFYDTAYANYRVKRVWEQKDTSGIAPSSFGYGSEYVDSLSIITKAHDITDGTHGTHVAGIASGSGSGGPLGNNSRYRGMAYNSEMVMVGIYPTSAYWLNTGMTDMLDGINYVFNYAASIGKAAVTNLSWGCPLGPHDGNSLFSQACDNLTGAGKIFVLSGGNNGTNNIHLRKTFTANDSTVNTFVTFSSYLTENKNWLDVWGDTAKPFCMKFSLYAGNNKVDTTTWICLDNNTQDLYLIGTNGDTCFVTITTVSSEFNDKPHMLIQLYSRVVNNLCVSIKGQDGTVDMWQGLVYKTSGYYGAFNKFSYSWAVPGNSQSVVSDMVTTKSAIAVAAYNSKTTFVNVAGNTSNYLGYNKGDIASFSSKGPTADGRTKPDIAGPGLALASSVSSVDSTFKIGGVDYGSVVSNYVSPVNSTNYSYAMLAGTSMSGPCVSGIVALLLQADPTLTPQEILSILKETAIQDSYTGPISATDGSNTWGWGKVNALAAIMKVLGIVGIEHQETNLNCLLYPNPGSGNYSIEYVGEHPGNLKVNVYDAIGRELAKEEWIVGQGSNAFHLSIKDYPKGIYFVKIIGEKGITAVKIMKQ